MVVVVVSEKGDPITLNKRKLRLIMGITQIQKTRNEHPLRKKLSELRVQPVDLATILGVTIQSVSKCINGYSPITKKIRDWLKEQGIDLYELDAEIEHWREEFKNTLTTKEKSQRTTIRGMFSGGSPIPKEKIDEAKKQWIKTTE